MTDKVYAVSSREPSSSVPPGTMDAKAPMLSGHALDPVPAATRRKARRRMPTGISQRIEEVREKIEQVAPFHSTVLITGESGTGKEVVARAIHDRSDRAAGPFVPVNCGAIPSDLLESELFGHEKGAFTGAITSRKGRFEMADGGTLFLDEIGDMSMPMQVKLLRVLQERCYERVGSNQTRHCNVRIIAATHCQLADAISKERFRLDLYYRLNVFPIEMPPLRKRQSDLPALVKDLIGQHARDDQPTLRLESGAMQALSTYAWPGNIRELSNLVERLAITHGSGPVGLNDLPDVYRAHVSPDEADVLCGAAEEDGGVAAQPGLPEGGLDLRRHLVNTEKQFIREALVASNGTVAGAARLLGLQRTTLVEKMRKYGMTASGQATKS